MPRDAVFAYYQHQIGDHFSTQGMRSNNRRRLERNRKFVDSPLEGTGFEPIAGGTDGSRTLRWRGVDSNLEFLDAFVRSASSSDLLERAFWR